MRQEHLTNNVTFNCGFLDQCDISGLSCWLRFFTMNADSWIYLLIDLPTKANKYIPKMSN